MQIRESGSDNENQDNDYRESESENETDNNDHNIILYGDTIGNTAYSQRFVIKCLMTLMNMTGNQITEHFIEHELCVLWDMTAEKDVIEYIIENSGTGILCHSLQSSQSSRIIEIIIGILSNMCCTVDGIKSITSDEENIHLVLDYVKSDDSRILIQVSRFIFSCVYYDRVLYLKWLNLLLNYDYVQSAGFILSNSSNCTLLKQTFETINCLCTVHDEFPGDELFMEMFKNKNYSECSVDGLKEICSQIEEDEESLDRIEILFIAIHSKLYKVMIENKDEQYLATVPTLFKTFNEILERHITKKTDDLAFMPMYLSKIFHVKKTFVCNEIFVLFDTILSRLGTIIASDSSSFESEEDVEENTNMTECVIDIMASFDSDTIKSYSGKLNTNILKHLKEKIQITINASETSKYTNLFKILTMDDDKL